MPDLPRRRPPNTGFVLRLLRTFNAALEDGRIPPEPFRACSPHPAFDGILIRIFPDDDEFRHALATLLDADTYEIKVQDVIGVAL